MLFSISVFLNLCDSQLVFFSICAILNLCNSQLVFFSIKAVWGRHRQLDDSLVGQLTSPVSDQSTWKMCSKKQETSTTGVKQTTGKRQALYKLKEIDLNGNRQTGNELTPPGGAHYLALALSSTGTI